MALTSGPGALMRAESVVCPRDEEGMEETGDPTIRVDR